MNDAHSFPRIIGEPGRIDGAFVKIGEVREGIAGNRHAAVIRADGSIDVIEGFEHIQAAAKFIIAAFEAR